MSDEGVFRPPGAPGGEVHPAPTTPLPPRQPPADEPGEDGQEAPAGRVYRTGPRRWRPDVLPDTAWRVIGAGAAVVLYAAGAGLPWWRTEAQECARLYPPGSLRDACAHVTAGGSGLAVWLALTTGVVLVVRLARLGSVLLDAVPAGTAALADLLAGWALFHRPAAELHLTWVGPLATAVLLGVLTVAAVQVYRDAGMSLQEMTEQARAARADRPGPRIPEWLRPGGMRRWGRDDRYYYPSWRRRRRRRRLLIAVTGLAGFVAIAHGCARLDSTPLPAPAADPGDAAGAGPPGQGLPASSPSPSAPDGVDLVEAARQAVATSHAVHVQVDQVAGVPVTADLELTADLRAAGTITTSTLAIYTIRRIGAACWIRGLPGHGVAAWVRTCIIPASHGAPRLDVAALTDWRLMVAPLPDPAGAVTAPEPVSLGLFGGDAWQVTTPDGSVVYLPAGGGDPHPVRVTTTRGRLGAIQADYDRWNDAITITPP